MREELSTLREEFREASSLARSVLELGALPSETRIESAVARLTNPCLSILMVGGTQVGKSTLLNALAGAPLSDVGQGAATTQNAVFYTPQDILEEDLPFKKGSDVRVSHREAALAGKVIVDAPDCDSFRLENKKRSLELLTACDVVLVVTSWEKYNQLSLHRLLSPELRGRSRASFVIVVNKVDELAEQDESLVLADVRATLSRAGVTNPAVFALSALRAYEEKRREAPPSQWTQRLAVLEEHLKLKLDRKIKDSNVAQEMRDGLTHLVGGPDSGSTVAALSAFSQAVETAEMDFRRSLRTVVESVLEAHQGSFLATLRGIVGDRISGGFGTYLAALAYLRPSRVAALFTIPGTRSAEQSLLDGVAESLAGRLSHQLVDGLNTYLRKTRAAPDALVTKIRPALDSLTRIQVRGWTSRFLNLPVFVVIHTAPLVLIYQYVRQIDPARVLMWVLTLPFVLISIMEVERFLYETFWLRRVVRERVKGLSASLDDSVMEAVGEGALAGPRQAQRAIGTLIERHRTLSARIALLTDGGQGT
ncbi:MAG: 50S ribosome-binding GTPase [Candidatus Riflebacteria bacterium]|nr:50S ribosome-binding GTPase [Candidatus Riflebacteria bacterium]